MTVITYSSAAGRLLKEIQVLEHPSASGNAPDLLSEIEKPRTVRDPSQGPIPGFCGVKSQSRTKEKEDLEIGGGVKGGNWQRKRQTWGREDLCNLQKRVIRNDSQGSGQSRRKGKDESPTGVSGILSAAETEGEINRWATRKGKSWPVCPWLFLLKKKKTEGKTTRETNVDMKRYHIVLWLTVLSLCLQPASSQVRVAVKSPL